MTGMSAAIADAHRKNLARYRELLAMDLTQTEREYIHHRISETRLALKEIGGSELAARTDDPAGGPSDALGTKNRFHAFTPWNA